MKELGETEDEDKERIGIYFCCGVELLRGEGVVKGKAGGLLI